MPAQSIQKEFLQTRPVIPSHSSTHGELFMINLATEEPIYQRRDIYVGHLIRLFVLECLRMRVCDRRRVETVISENRE